MKEWIEDRRASMNYHERILYYLFKKQKGVKLGSKYSGIKCANRETESKRLASKIDPSWELRDLYYDLGEKSRNEDK